MSDWATVSAAELEQAQAAIAREVQRREAMGAAARAEQFNAELAEIRAGSRRVDSEHVAYLTPGEVLAAVDNGQVPGVGADRRKRRR